MSTELWVAILTFGTAVVGAIRWLIHVYWRQAEQIEDLRSQNEKRNLNSLKEAIDELKKELREQRRSMADISERILKAQGSIERAAKDNKDLSVLVSQYIEKSVKRFEKIETDLIDIGKGLVLVKGSSGAKKD
jgi:predicted  nucleic acid-binding Zn-ribbon protein